MDRVHEAVSGQILPAAKFNELQDNALGIAQVPGLLIGGDRVSSDGATIRVSHISTFVIGTNRYGGSGDLVITPSGLVAGTWYYIYAYISGGVIAAELSADVPWVGYTFKNLTSTHRYLGCVRATGAAAVLPFRKSGNRYRYRVSAGPASDTFNATNGVLSGAGITTWADLTLAHHTSGETLLPPHARLAQIELRVERGSGTGQLQAGVRTKGDATTLGAGDDSAHRETEIETDSSQRIQWAATFDAVPTPDEQANLAVRVLGFTE
jgi:hypothetical protein